MNAGHIGIGAQLSWELLLTAEDVPQRPCQNRLT